MSEIELDFYPSSQQNSRASHKLLVTKTNDERVEERTPGVALFPLVLKKVFADVCEGRAEGEAAFRIKGLVEEHGED